MVLFYFFEQQVKMCTYGCIILFTLSPSWIMAEYKFSNLLQLSGEINRKLEAIENKVDESSKFRILVESLNPSWTFHYLKSIKKPFESNLKWYIIWKEFKNNPKTISMYGFWITNFRCFLDGSKAIQTASKWIGLR